MNKAMQLGAALGGAALVVAAGSAYTDAVSGLPAAGVYAFGSTTYTGVAVTGVAYAQDAADPSLLDGVTYTTTTDVDSGYTAKLYFNGDPTPHACTINAFTTTGTIECLTLDEPIDTIDEIALKVYPTAQGQ